MDLIGIQRHFLMKLYHHGFVHLNQDIATHGNGIQSRGTRRQGWKSVVNWLVTRNMNVIPTLDFAKINAPSRMDPIRSGGYEMQITYHSCGPWRQFNFTNQEAHAWLWIRILRKGTLAHTLDLVIMQVMHLTTIRTAYGFLMEFQVPASIGLLTNLTVPSKLIVFVSQGKLSIQTVLPGSGIWRRRVKSTSKRLRCNGWLKITTITLIKDTTESRLEKEAIEGGVNTLIN